MFLFIREKGLQGFRLHRASVFVAFVDEEVDQLIDGFIAFRRRVFGFVRQSVREVDHRGNAEDLA